MGMAGHWRAEALSLVLALGLLATLFAPYHVHSALAQQPPAPAEPAPEADPQAPPPPALEASAADRASDQVAPPPQQKSVLWWIMESSGLIGAVILMLSIYFLATVGRLFFELRPQVAAPPELVADLTDLLEKREFKEIYAVVKENKSFLSRMLSAGISELPSGLAEARESMERVNDAGTVEMERKISMLAVLGTLGPMIGLLGTLKGMIVSFSAIALSDTQLKASEVAGGISEALILTFEGVALSVPAIYFFAVFRNRVSGISVATGLQADEYLRHFAHAARAKATPAAAAAAAPVAVAKPAKP